ncbi:zinc finger MYND domain-containing protein [Phanerochaete sordida]|uniref:Zinc finger MYND domain-containing protein n=1 Tax=Phanerochaete sordida TaxID=48140 RepID=A0A9P3GPF0_9APHY|nr:zinc finger MYND domain-containing protein [Phanerochaete sordida]
MAGSSVHRHPEPHAHPRRRPGLVRVRHTWHGETSHRSHFEDFMREIGVNAEEIHTCCVPRPAVKESTRVRSMSDPTGSTTPHEATVAPQTPTGRGRSVRERGVRRQSLPTLPFARPHSPPGTIAAPRRPSPPSRAASALEYNQHAPKRVPAPPPPKASALTALYTQNHGASYLCTALSADQALRDSMRVTLVRELSRGSAREAHAGDRACWEPLPACPALVPARRVPSPSPPPGAAGAGPGAPARLSRVPSFASLETVSSSEGPATPRGSSPLHSPTTLGPSLSALERQSRLRVPAQCVACKRAGHNFPSCPTCGDSWCSRECRVAAAAGSRHVCAHRKGTPSPPSEAAGAVPLALGAES